MDNKYEEIKSDVICNCAKDYIKTNKEYDSDTIKPITVNIIDMLVDRPITLDFQNPFIRSKVGDHKNIKYNGEEKINVYLYVSISEYRYQPKTVYDIYAFNEWDDYALAFERKQCYIEDDRKSLTLLGKIYY